MDHRSLSSCGYALLLTSSFACLLGCSPVQGVTALAASDPTTDVCLGLSELRFSLADVELRTERIVWGHASGGDYVVVLNRFTEIESVMADDLAPGLEVSQIEQLSKSSGLLRESVQGVSGTSLNLKAQKKKMEREFKYLREDIIKSTYPAEQPRPYALLLSAQRMLDSDINVIGVAGIERLLAENREALLGYCAPSYHPCADPQYKSGALFAKAVSEYITLYQKLVDEFATNQDHLDTVRESVVTHVADLCGG